jgi:hypothetical protein
LRLQISAAATKEIVEKESAIANAKAAECTAIKTDAEADLAEALPALDEALHGGLARAALHEFHAVEAADSAAAGGMVLALARRAAERRPIVLVRQDFLDLETGALHPAGLPELGLDPSRLVVVRVRDVAGLLQAGVEAARCPALGAVKVGCWAKAAGVAAAAKASVDWRKWRRVGGVCMRCCEEARNVSDLG